VILFAICGDTNCATIYILEFAKVAQILKLPACKLDNHTAYPRADSTHGGDMQIRGIPFMQPMLSHVYHQYAFPWWLWASLAHSSIRTFNIDEADFVFVDSYCYTKVWISNWQHGEDVIKRIWIHISNTPRYRRHGGRDFIIAFPHLLQRRLFCNVSGASEGNPIMLVPEERDVCSTKAVIVPFFSSPITLFFDRNDPKFSFFAAFMASCAEARHNGKWLRYIIAKELPQHLQSAPLPSKIECVSNVKNSVHKILHESIFCLVLAGDSPSSRRLSEVILNGCVPVFIGPPWHTLPLRHIVPYHDFSVFIQHLPPLPWIDPDAMGCGSLPYIQAQHIHNVSNIKEIADLLLQSFHTGAVHNLRFNLSRYRKFFLYESHMRDRDYPSNANDVLVRSIIDVNRNSSMWSPRHPGQC